MADAPRFRAYLGHINGHSVLTMDRESWARLRTREGSAVFVDLDATPLARVAEKAEVVASTALRRSHVSSEIEIVRYDQKDHPTPYNIDRYTVYEDMPRHPDFGEIVAASSTSDNADLRQFLTEHVLLVKQKPGPDHWSATPPSSALTVFRSSS